jgi:hypothetical protein
MYDIGVFQFRTDAEEGFKIALHRTNPNAPTVSFYINMRTPENPKPGPLTQRLVDDIGKELYFFSVECNLSYTAFAGVPNVATPFAKAFDDVQRKAGNKKRLLEISKLNQLELQPAVQGDLQLNDNILLIDDLVTSFTMKMQAKKLLENRFRCRVENCVVLIDRRPTRLRMKDFDGTRLHAIVTMEDIIRLFQEERGLTEAHIVPALRTLEIV